MVWQCDSIDSRVTLLSMVIRMVLQRAIWMVLQRDSNGFAKRFEWSCNAIRMVLQRDSNGFATRDLNGFATRLERFCNALFEWFCNPIRMVLQRDSNGFATSDSNGFATRIEWFWATRIQSSKFKVQRFDVSGSADWVKYHERKELERGTVSMHTKEVNIVTLS